MRRRDVVVAAIQHECRCESRVRADTYQRYVSSSQRLSGSAVARCAMADKTARRDPSLPRLRRTRGATGIRLRQGYGATTGRHNESRRRREHRDGGRGWRPRRVHRELWIALSITAGRKREAGRAKAKGRSQKVGDGRWEADGEVQRKGKSVRNTGLAAVTHNGV